MKKHTSRFFIQALLICFSTHILAGAFEDGLTAYDKGLFDNSVSIWEPLAEAGNANAQYRIGMSIEAKAPTPKLRYKLLDDANHWYKKAAEQGHVDAMHALGTNKHLLERTDRKWLKKAASMGNTKSMLLLYSDYSKKGNYDEAEKWLHKIVDAGSYEYYGRLYGNQFYNRKDYRAAVKTRAEALRHKKSYFIATAFMALHSNGNKGYLAHTDALNKQDINIWLKTVDKDDVKTWLEISAKEGKESGYHKKLSPLDLETSKTIVEFFDLIYLRKQSDFMQSMFGEITLTLGMIYFEEKNYLEAFKWLSESARVGRKKAFHLLGKMHEGHYGVPQSYEKSFELYTKSYNSWGGYKYSSALAIANLYEKGRFVEKDYTKAADWASKAYKSPNKEIKNKVIKKLNGYLTELANLSVSSNTNIRSRPDVKSRLITKVNKEDMLLKLAEKNGWTEVIKAKGVYVGYIRSDLLIPYKKVVKNNSPYPSMPDAKPGYLTCNTQCTNSNCYRTYSDGKKVSFQAKQKWNSMFNRFEWDSGSC